MQTLHSSTNRSPELPALETVSLALMAAAMALPLAGPVHAESAPERGLISLKTLDYQDSQPGDPRIHVRASALNVMVPLSSEWVIGATATSDAISGASPAYHTSGLKQMHDHRHALETSVTKYLPNATLTVGGNISSESDYLSRGVSVQATRSSEDKNTTWSAGFGFNSDVINPSNGVVSNETKHVTDLLLGVTQVLTSNDIVQMNLGLSLGQGYFSDPYKVFDERPRQRNHATVMARWNHYVESTEGTVRSSYRYYADSWRIKSHTVGVEYVQPLADGWTLTPMVRLYTQSAASFYVNADPGTYPFPPNPPADAQTYSEDQRVSAFGARTISLKVAKQLNADWTLDLKLERYGQRADWRLFGSGSTGLAPFNYRSIQIGVSRQF
jgi:hypothetical protein